MIPQGSIDEANHTYLTSSAKFRDLSPASLQLLIDFDPHAPSPVQAMGVLLERGPEHEDLEHLDPQAVSDIPPNFDSPRP
mgnify:CR=1 FL=1